MSIPEPLVQTRDLSKWFPLRRGLFSHSYLKAVDGVSLSVNRGEVVALMGESGCGKSTLGQLLVRLQEPTAGRIQFADSEVLDLRGAALRSFRRRAQIVFQNPYEAFDSRYRIGSALEDPLRIHGIGFSSIDRRKRIWVIMQRAGLQPVDEYLNRYPHELSGGQLQRVALARVMLLEPEFLIADEPVSMLDVCVRAEVLNFLLEMRESQGMSMLFITHDIGVARYVADWIAVMYLGKVVEEGPTEDVIARPLHPYTQALIRSAPNPDPRRKRQPLQVTGEPSTPIDPPQACRFADRCPHVEAICREANPELLLQQSNRKVACFMYTPGEEQPGNDGEREQLVRNTCAPRL